MSTLKEQLIQQLEQQADVKLEFWKDTELLGVNYKAKEIAHFQTNAQNEIDIRLTPAIIKKEKLSVPETVQSHPDRSKNSRWIIQTIESSEDVERIVRLIDLAKSLYT